MSNPPKLSPLSIKCTSTDCDNGFHCFKVHRKMALADHGKCRSCNADLINWGRVHKRDFSDARHTFSMLKNELIRHSFFHREIDDGAIRHAQRKGRDQLLEAARARLEKYLAPAAPARDGRQTPLSGNAIFYAQHAVACCCRTCLEYWHNIPKGRPLTDEEIDYCAALVALFLEERLPDLLDEAIKVPVRRKTDNDDRTSARS